MEVRFASSVFRDLELPLNRREHSLVQGRVFYTLPAALLEILVGIVGRGRFDTELLALEFELSGTAGDHGYTVGFRDGQPVPYHLLEPRQPIRITPEQAASAGWSKTADELRELERVGTERLDRFGLPVRGYAGWLMSTPTFVSEHDELVHRYRSQLRQHGFPRPLLATPGISTGENVRQRTAGPNEWTQAFRSFFARWRLQSLAGPGLPLPLEPQLPDMLNRSTGPAAAEGCTSFTVPDIFPLHGRGEVHEIMQDAVRSGGEDSHLDGWLTIVAADSTAANQIPRFVRLFRLQHLVRVLYSRHADALSRRKTALLMAFAEFFDVSEDAVKRDWRFLDGRLEKDWPHREIPLV